jgi:hypothetical protein
MKLDQARCSSIYRIVEVGYILLRLSTPSRHLHAIQKTHTLDSRPLIGLNSCVFKSWKNFPQVKLVDEFGVCCCQRNRIFSDP